MGGSSPGAPTTIMPAPTPPPTLYRSVIPEGPEGYGAVQDRTDRLTKVDIPAALAKRDEMVGTPTDIGKRVADRNALTAAAYLSSLPTGAGYDAVKAAAAVNLAEARNRATTLKQQPDKPSV